MYKYDHAGTRLNGRVIQRSVYGPPGYGEAPATGPKVKITILQLDCPIDIRPERNAKAPETSNLTYFHKIKEIQLFFDNKAQKHFALQHLGRTVIVNGRLEEAVAGGEYTKVIMTVEQIH